MMVVYKILWESKECDCSCKKEPELDSDSEPIIKEPEMKKVIMLQEKKDLPKIETTTLSTTKKVPTKPIVVDWNTL